MGRKDQRTDEAAFRLVWQSLRIGGVHKMYSLLARKSKAKAKAEEEKKKEEKKKEEKKKEEKKKEEKKKEEKVKEETVKKKAEEQRSKQASKQASKQSKQGSGEGKEKEKEKKTSKESQPMTDETFRKHCQALADLKVLIHQDPRVWAQIHEAVQRVAKRPARIRKDQEGKVTLSESGGYVKGMPLELDRDFRHLRRYVKGAYEDWKFNPATMNDEQVK